VTEKEKRVAAWCMAWTALAVFWLIAYAFHLIMTPEMQWWSLPATFTILGAGFALWWVVIDLLEIAYKRLSHRQGGSQP
jgi:hypothetical protein